MTTFTDSDYLKMGMSQWIDNEETEVSVVLHPGKVLRHTLDARKIGVKALAGHIGVARPGFNNMLLGKRSITTPIARKIERAIGFPASTLMHLQVEYDLADPAIDEEVEAVVRLYA